MTVAAVVSMLLLVAATAGAARGYDRSGLHGWTLPDLAATPGVVVLHEAEKVCAVHWGKDVRHVTQTMKRRVCVHYGAGACPGPRWELDHLVSRELGGADDERNLWPQPIREARIKDRLENWLHRQVCAGRLTLAAAQRCIRDDWTRCYAAHLGSP